MRLVRGVFDLGARTIALGASLMAQGRLRPWMDGLEQQERRDMGIDLMQVVRGPGAEDTRSRSRPQGPWRVAYIAASVTRAAREMGGVFQRMGREGFEVHVVAGEDGESGADDLRAAGVAVRALPDLSGANPASWIGAAVLAQAHLIEHPMALVHAHGERMAWLGTLAARAAKAPCVVASMEDHELLRSGATHPMARSAWSALEPIGWTPKRAWRALMDRVDRYIVHHREDLKWMLDHDLAPASRIEAVIGSPGVDFVEFDPKGPGLPTREEALEMFGAPERAQVVAGAFLDEDTSRERRALSVLADYVSRQNAGVWWVVVCASPESAQHVQKFLGDRGEALGGALEDARLAYHVMDVLVGVSASSGVDRRVLEAASMEVPTVGVSTPSRRAVIEEDQTGRLVEEGDVTGLASVLLEEVSHRALLRARGGFARAHVTKRFARRAVHDQYVRLYDAVLSGRFG
ncbi:MAG: glycosyltransferase family 4 protein [Myxococcota bacterium]